jgi:glutamyl-tRNA synthetase
LRSQSNEKLAEQLKKLVPADSLSTESTYLAAVCGLMKERATFIKDILIEGDYFFGPITSYDDKTVAKKWQDDTSFIMKELLAELKEITTFTKESIEQVFSAYLAKNEYNFGKVGPGFRLLVTGKGMGPSMFEICATLGKETVISRMEDGLVKIKQLKTTNS